MNVPLQIAERLTPKELKLFDLVVSKPGTSRAQAMEFLYPGVAAPPDPATIRVLLSRIRTKLSTLGISIVMERGYGYRLTESSCAALARIQEAA